jgi:hypothetical protein
MVYLLHLEPPSSSPAAIYKYKYKYTVLHTSHIHTSGVNLTPCPILVGSHTPTDLA